MAEKRQTPKPRKEGPEAVPSPTDDPTAAGQAPDQSAEDLAEAALQKAEEAVEAIGAVEAGPPPTPTPPPGQPEAVHLPDFESRPGSADDQAAGLGLLDDVQLNVKIELGRTQMYVEDVLRLNESSVVELDKVAGDPVDIYVNNRRVARGEVLVLNENFCVRVSEILDQVTPGD
ncbi:MAG: flagellar motor switch protein FliN [Planctomycetota bacterium]|jgi:flagellar motor switch protein FliN/FliY